MGASILWLTYSEKYSESQISGLVAKGSFSCLSLIAAFSTVIDACEAVTDLAGTASRLSELLAVLEEKEREKASRCVWVRSSLKG